MAAARCAVAASLSSQLGSKIAPAVRVAPDTGPVSLQLSSGKFKVRDCFTQQKMAERS